MMRGESGEDSAFNVTVAAPYNGRNATADGNMDFDEQITLFYPSQGGEDISSESAYKDAFGNTFANWSPTGATEAVSAVGRFEGGNMDTVITINRDALLDLAEDLMSVNNYRFMAYIKLYPSKESVSSEWLSEYVHFGEYHPNIPALAVGEETVKGYTVVTGNAEDLFGMLSAAGTAQQGESPVADIIMYLGNIQN
ncbi:MAG: hypothetical protein LBS19_14480, partial [Clostridiales bacterium]|jgi:hypothetical protein|nr:hypothetical protein [Clostridiales bacterium]